MSALVTSASFFPAGTTGSLRDRFEAAQTLEEFLPTAEQNADLWAGVYRRAVVPEAHVERVAALPGRWHLLVLSEDWCGDAANSIPVLARLAELAPNLELRLLSRDENPDLMDAHLTNGTARAIPVVMLLDEDFVERGWWGSRPAELQRWVVEEGLKMEPGPRYRLVRQWYARDRGLSTLNEVVEALETVAAGG